eukprot:g29232.t1
MGAALVTAALLTSALSEELYFLGQREGDLHCLGSCSSCHDALQQLPRGRFEVCDLLLMFPVDIQREAWSLAALPSEEYLSYRGATQDDRTPPFEELSRAHTERLRSNVLEVVLGRNDSVLALLGRANLALAQAQEKQSSEGKTSLVFLASGASERVLSELALELGRTARLVVEHSRTVWGLKQLVLELSGVYPNIQSQLPTYRIQPFYGRHFDVLEALLSSLEEDKGPELRMAELGVACGPIGLHLLARFSGLQYYGADPTIKEEVREAYQPYAERAQLFATTSEEMHTRLSDGPLMDFVFIDGPHTYANVRNDLHLWEQRVRPGGIVAGHDFTVRHPPLLWAVSEYRMTHEAHFKSWPGSWPSGDS